LHFRNPKNRGRKQERITVPGSRRPKKIQQKKIKMFITRRSNQSKKSDSSNNSLHKDKLKMEYTNFQGLILF